MQINTNRRPASALVLLTGVRPDGGHVGQPTRTLKPGDGFQVPRNAPHAGGKSGEEKIKIAITYVLDKGKPLASPA